MIEDCRITDWRDPRGAIQVGTMGPTVMIDTTFTGAPAGAAAAVAVENPQHGLVHSQCATPAGVALVQGPAGSRETCIPAGARTGNLPATPIRFFSGTAIATGKVFDARRDFGAMGDGRTDDTAAVQETIDAARRHGKNALAYLPFGTYRLTRALQVQGADYTLGGGNLWSSILQYDGEAGAVLAVADPQNITLQHFRIEVPETLIPQVAKITQQSSGKGSSIVYDSVWMAGSWRLNKSALRGLEMKDLGPGDVVRFRHLDGSLRLTDCSGAQIYADIHMDGKLVVEGKKPIAPGFLGMWIRNCSGNDYDNEVHDNHSLIAADIYTEQTSAMLLANGGDAPRDRPGRITLHGAKSCWQHILEQTPADQRRAKNEGMFLHNYHGQLFSAGFNYMYQEPSVITQTGDRPVELAFVGNGFANVAPEFRMEKSARLTFLENLTIITNRTALPSATPDPSFRAVVNAFDHFRELGAIDLEMNRPR
jgi:hypothetical protein